MAAPLVSVTVPTCDQAYCLGRTLHSVLTQTHRNLEVIVVDDGSTDVTEELVSTFAPRSAADYDSRRFHSATSSPRCW